MDGWSVWKSKIEMEKGYAVMMFTDRFEVDGYPLSPECEQMLESGFEDKLLDMRVFNEEKEYRIFRGDAGRDFHFRERDDKGLSESDFYDDEQYLDIDTERSAAMFRAGHMVRATGGGIYRLPLETMNNAKVEIRNYVGYDEETGQAYLKDWRLRRFFVEKGGKADDAEGRF